MADFDWANEGGLAALGAGVKGFAQGWMDAEDRQNKKLEMEAKTEAQKAEKERNAFLDQMTMRDKGYQKGPDGSPQVDPNLQRQKDVREFAPKGLIAQYDEQGNLTGTKYDPEYVRMQQEKAAADPYGLKAAQGQNALRPTEGESKAAGFARRMEGAEAKLTNLLTQGFDPTSTKTQANEMLGGDSVIGKLTERAKDPQVKQYEQIKNDFISAVLRQESGAAIGKEERRSEEKKYFPQPGDTPEVLEQKTASRAQALASLSVTGGRAMSQIPALPIKPAGKLSSGKLATGKLDTAAPPPISGEDAKLKRLAELRAKAAK